MPRSMSLSREIAEGKGQTWGAVAVAAATAYSGWREGRSRDKDRREQKRQEEKYKKEEKRALEADRIWQSAQAQNSFGLLSTDGSNTGGISPLVLLLFGGVILFVLMR